MRIFMLSLGFILLLACKDQPTTSQSELAAQATPQTVTKYNPQRQANEVVRPKKRVIDHTPNADFPFNVTLKEMEASAKGGLTNSNEIFKKNGKPTVLLFWLSTCGPCKNKMTKIKPLYAQWQEEADFNLYAISGDWAKNFDKAVAYAEAQNWPWPTYNDVNRGFRGILPGELNGYPQSFIFDKEGKLVYQDKKFRFGDEQKLWAAIKEISS